MLQWLLNVVLKPAPLKSRSLSLRRGAAPAAKSRRAGAGADARARRPDRRRDSRPRLPHHDYQRRRLRRRRDGRARSARCSAGVDIIVATPGRLMDHMRQQNADLSGVELLVLDEADRMMDMGFWPDVRRIIAAMPADAPDAAASRPRCRTMSCDRRSRSCASRSACRSVSAARPPRRSRIERMSCRAARKLELADRASAATRRTRADFLADEDRRRSSWRARLAAAGIRCVALHADRDDGSAPAGRWKDSRAADIQVLVATDIAARGLDIDGIHTVINYEAARFRRHVRPPRGTYRAGGRSRPCHHARRARKNATLLAHARKVGRRSFRIGSIMSDPFSPPPTRRTMHYARRQSTCRRRSRGSSLAAGGGRRKTAPECCGHRDVLPMAGTTGFDPEAVVPRLRVLQATSDAKETRPGRISLLS